MRLTELVKTAEVVVDAKGNEKVVLDLAVWQEILAVLEEADAERRWDELFAKSPDMLVRLADEARAERRAGRTRDLDPDSL